MGLVDILMAGLAGHLFGHLEFHLQAVQLTDSNKRAVLGCLTKWTFDEQSEKAHGKLVLLVAGIH